ncbi:MAG: molybdopterin molybdotransferase MoeA [Spirochaetaceae bacterium]|jgi:molybdopterin molybdotransferase|nr:molybdopterin molybdotransferase MoeA [Spirochaetaceae bacterium]
MESVMPELARELLLAETEPVAGSVVVPLMAALGGVTAREIYAPRDNPPFDRSALDGFAFRSGETAAASEQVPARFRLSGVIYAGDAGDTGPGPGEAVKIMTGAPIPPGADCMIGKENARAEGGEVIITGPIAKHDNVIFRGEDIEKGALLFPAGTVLKSAHLGVLASMGFDKAEIRRPVSIGLFCTGDEIVPPGTPLPPGKIYNSNETLVAARLKELGFSAEVLPQMDDDAGKVAQLIEKRIADFDLLVTTGAVSVGDKDIFHEVFAKLGVRRIFSRLRTRPGQAVLCGKYQNKLLVCLSGNPFAAILAFELLVRPVLAKMSGSGGIQYRKAILGTPFSKKAGIRRFVRAKLADGCVTLPGGNTSGRLFTFADCNCFVDIPSGTETLQPGDEVDILLC